MDKKENHIDSDTSAVQEAGQQGQSRRRFIRTAAIGSAVVLTLGNRAAWGSNNYGGKNWGFKKDGKKSFESICLSASVYESWRKGDPSSVAHHEKEVDKFSKYWNSGKYKRFVDGYGEDKKYCVKVPDRKDRWW